MRRKEGDRSCLQILEENSVRPRSIHFREISLKRLRCHKERLVFLQTDCGILWTSSYSLDLLLWTPFPLNLNGRGILDLVGDNLVFSNKKRCEAIDIETGKERWIIQSETKIWGATGDETDLYLDSSGSQIERWDQRSRERTALWELSPPNCRIRNLFFHQGHLYVFCLNHKKDCPGLQIWDKDGRMVGASFAATDIFWMSAAGNNMLCTVDSPWSSSITLWK